MEEKPGDFSFGHPESDDDGDIDSSDVDEEFDVQPLKNSNEDELYRWNDLYHNKGGN